MHTTYGPYFKAWERQWDSDIKRQIHLVWFPEHVGVPPYPQTKRQEVLVGLKRQRVRLRYPDSSYSKVQYLDGASQDLKAMSALFICDLIPVAIYADKLEEEFPQHKQAAQIMRDWQKVKEQYTK